MPFIADLFLLELMDAIWINEIYIPNAPVLQERAIAFIEEAL